MGRDGALVSTALTSTLHRRRTPKKNRIIPTIPAGNIDAGHVHVSAVDTGPHGNESGLLTAEPGASVTGPPPARCLRRVPEAMVRRRLRPESARVGLLHEGGVRPDDAGSHHSHRAGPLRQAEAAALPSGSPTQPVSQMS